MSEQSIARRPCGNLWIEEVNKDSLVQQKEYPTESLSKSRESVYRNKCSMFHRNSRTVERL
ncbi:hypothetical protein Taro_042244 [Colocasia esculenta]|uniref:Uncharacterized protein n=1 Tax=Colocasia esculenta TaxID=4460 RepID=A0A843WVY3_COLES|nr:hypothetical protein [Colocasia esculenta]